MTTKHFDISTFPIGFWNYTFMDMVGPDCVRDWSDAGMTMAMSPEFLADRDDAGAMRAILDAALERKLKVILCDHRANWWRGTAADGEAAYRRGFAEALKDFGDHPAVFGFHVGDEPVKADFANACKANRIQQEMAPHLTPFLNLLPWYPGAEADVGFPSWAAYLDAFVDQAHPAMIPYDCYSQMKPGREGWEQYYINLREYKAASERHGLPLWSTLLTVGHYHYRCPSEDDLRWQVNTNLAHGVQGLLWFHFYMVRPHDNYRLAPIDEFWERTETFAWLSRVNRTLLAWHAPVLRELTLKRVHHVGEWWGGFAPPDGKGLIREAHASEPLIVSEFADPRGRPYVVVVNNSVTDSTKASLTIAGAKPTLHRVVWQGKEELVQGGGGWQAMQSDDSVRVTPWLAPGQMEMYRVAFGA